MRPLRWLCEEEEGGPLQQATCVDFHRVASMRPLRWCCCEAHQATATGRELDVASMRPLRWLCEARRSSGAGRRAGVASMRPLRWLCEEWTRWQGRFGSPGRRKHETLAMALRVVARPAAVRNDLPVASMRPLRWLCEPGPRSLGQAPELAVASMRPLRWLCEFHSSVGPFPPRCVASMRPLRWLCERRQGRPWHRARRRKHETLAMALREHLFAPYYIA